MEQWLPRGTSVTKEKRIKKMITASKDWQIYSTNQDSYVLAATRSIYKEWTDNFSLPEGIFTESNDYKVFCSSGNYLISSLDKGPYPENNGQVEAFSIAFNTTLKLFPDTDLQDAVYIEEYSLILPGAQSNELTKKECVYGKWLTGGVNISANSFKRIVQFMSWMPVAALNKSFELAGFEIPEITEEETEKNEVVSNDLQPVDSESGIVPAIMPTDKFTLIGRPDLEQFFNDNIIDIVLNQEQYKRMGISFPGATILHGPPGCGKTYAVEKLAEYLGWKRFDIDSSSIASSFIHDTSKKISEVFNSAIKAAPSIIVIDEMEAFLSSRNMAGPSGTHHIEEVAEFLRRIPEAISKGVLVFAMTNMIDTIDTAILRRGRFDHIIEVKMANKEEISALLKMKFSIPGIETFIEHTGVDNVEHVLSLFEKTRSKGIQATANIAVTKKNLPELYENIAYALIKGADYVLLNRFLPGGRGLKNQEYLLSKDETNQMLDIAEEVLSKANKYGHVGTELPLCAINNPDKYKHIRVSNLCSAAKGFCIIDPSGYLKVCNHSPIRICKYNELDNLENHTYWNSFRQRDYIPNMCKGCDKLDRCDGGCREAAHVYYGEINAPDPIF